MTGNRRGIVEYTYYDVFISYDHEYELVSQTASRLAAALEQAGYSVWWDRSLLAGDDWANAIQRMCGSALRVVALMTRRSVTRPWCKLELSIGITAGTLIPIKLEPCEMPADISTTAGSIQFAHLSPDDPTLSKYVIAALRLTPSNISRSRAVKQTRQSHSNISQDVVPTESTYFSYLMALLRTQRDQLVKIATQELCTQLESGFALNDNQKGLLSEQFQNLWDKTTYKTRNWIVKAAGLCKLRALAPRIIAMFNHESTDEETKSWLLASYYNIFGAERAIELMKSSPAFSATYAMALQFYSPIDLHVLEASSITKAIEANPIAAKWTCFFHGYNHPGALSLTGFTTVEVVADLTSHHDDSVVEHALWSMHRGRKGNIDDSKISLGDIHVYAPNIRRRTYILIGKHELTFNKYLKFLASRIYIENDSYAREGLANSIATKSRYNYELEKIVEEWFLRDSEVVVRMALLPHIIQYADYSVRYQSILRNILHSGDLEPILNLRYRVIAARLPASFIAVRLRAVHQSSR